MPEIPNVVPMTTAIRLGDQRLDGTAPEFSNLTSMSVSSGSVLITFGYANPLDKPSDRDPNGTPVIVGRVIRQIAMPPETFANLALQVIGILKSSEEREKFGWQEIVRAVTAS